MTKVTFTKAQEQAKQTNALMQRELTQNTHLPIFSSFFSSNVFIL